MGKYKDKLSAFVSESDSHFTRMFDFGEKMMDKMGLESNDLKCSDMAWSILGFTLSIRSFPQNKWQPTIIAVPEGSDGSKIGYSNTQETAPKGWYYSPNGTATVFYPPEFIQLSILNLI